MRSVTVVLPISRPWRIKTMADQIRNIKTDDIQLDVLLVVDNINIPKSTIYRCFSKIPFAMHYTGNSLPSEANIQQRRQRIAANMNIARELCLPTDFVFLLEDDTDFEPFYLEKLLAMYKPDRGVVSAVQAGRHGLFHIGAWETDDPSDPKVFETVPYRSKGSRQVDATGFYCCVIKTSLFKRVPIPCEPSPVGPDVQYCVELKKQGYKNVLMDDLVCGHVEQNRVLYPTEECVQLRFRKNGERWELTTWQ